MSRSKTRVYVGGFPRNTTGTDLEKFFSGFGMLREILIKHGYGFVEFDNHRDAEDAIYELNGKRLLGDRVNVELARGQPRGRDRCQLTNYRARPIVSYSRYHPTTQRTAIRTKYRLIVKNLSTHVHWRKLKDFMGQAGEVTYANAHKGEPNSGIVEFATRAGMENAIELLDDAQLSGRRIRLIEDKGYRYRTSKSHSSSHSRSRSRSPRRSKYASRSRSRSTTRSYRTVSKSRSQSKSKDGEVPKIRKSHSKSAPCSLERKKSSSIGADKSNNGQKAKDEARPKDEQQPKDEQKVKNAQKPKEQDLRNGQKPMADERTKTGNEKK